MPFFLLFLFYFTFHHFIFYKHISDTGRKELMSDKAALIKVRTENIEGSKIIDENEERVKYYDELVDEYGFDENEEEDDEDEVDDFNVIPMPLPRNVGTIQTSFTPRAFPTPKRESVAEEEEVVITISNFK